MDSFFSLAFYFFLRLPFTSVGVLYINLAGYELSPYFLSKIRLHFFFCLKSQVPSYSLVQFLSSLIPWSNPQLSPPTHVLVSGQCSCVIRLFLWQPRCIGDQHSIIKRDCKYTLISLLCHHFPFGSLTPR